MASSYEWAVFFGTFLQTTKKYLGNVFIGKILGREPMSLERILEIREKFQGIVNPEVNEALDELLCLRGEMEILSLRERFSEKMLYNMHKERKTLLEIKQMAKKDGLLPEDENDE